MRKTNKKLRERWSTLARKGKLSAREHNEMMAIKERIESRPLTDEELKVWARNYLSQQKM